MADGPDDDVAVGRSAGGVDQDGSPGPGLRGGLSRRRLLLALGAAGAVGLGGAAWALTRPGTGDAPADRADAVEETIRDDGSGSPHALDEFAGNVRGGGPPRDGIPSIDSPVYVAAEQADFLDGDDVVFGLVVDGQARAYPQLVLVWHEILNEVDSTGPMSVTYCPLTGSAVGFRPHAEIEQFGTTGNLVNSNLLMYDRTHESTWPQILAQAIDGPRRVDMLEEFPLEWTTWQRWRDAFPDTQVLSAETGFVRRYGEDPYGSYNPLGGYYSDGAGRMFPIMTTDDRFDDKAVFLGAKRGDARLAVRKDLVTAQQIVTAEMDGIPVVFLHDPDLATGRAFGADADSGLLQLEPADVPGQYRDRRSGAVWDSWGTPVSGTDVRLSRVLAYDVMWFAWAAFFPHTAVIA